MKYNNGGSPSLGNWLIVKALRAKKIHLKYEVLVPVLRCEGSAVFINFFPNSHAKQNAFG